MKMAKFLLETLKQIAAEVETEDETKEVAAVMKSTVAHFERHPDLQTVKDILIALVLNALPNPDVEE